MIAAAGDLAVAPSPPAPLAGTPRYFALLYTPPAARAGLATLLALADEISAGTGRSLDHSVAHARLDWWRAEAARFRGGEPQHPWLRALLPPTGIAPRPEFAPLVDAAAIDLATATFGAAAATAARGAALQAAVFEQAANVLRGAAGAPPSLQHALRHLGQLVGELERLDGQQAATALAALRMQVAGIDRTQQPQLAPLLVWVALVAVRARRRSQRRPGKDSRALDAFADNMVAWNAARRATRGRFRID